MKKIWISSLYCLLGLYGLAQDYNITFTATGKASTIDSITAVNQRTGQTITFPGNATLVLRKVTGIPEDEVISSKIAIFPNPFSGESRILITLGKSQEANLRIQNLIGQIVAQKREFLQAGQNEFVFTVQAYGIYFIVFETQEGIESCKTVCMGSSGNRYEIQFQGLAGGSQSESSQNAIKTIQSGYFLNYGDGDIFNYTCYSGVMTTVLSDSPSSSKDYEVLFAECTDPDGQQYKVVQLGGQLWMAENLAYLPSVSQSNIYSDTLEYYYVYGYEGNSISKAKATSNYVTYGVLYNWEAAKTACPSGWHLPSDEEWKTLETHLGMTTDDADKSGTRWSGFIGKKLKSIIGWSENGNGDNSSGFNAVPGGLHGDIGGFFDLGIDAVFWSSTDYYSSRAWFRELFCSNMGMKRGNQCFRSNGFSVRCLKNKGAP